jgi:hypothetical protein
VRIQPGNTLLDVRNVHFEYWCIDALAGKLAEDPELRLDLPPRLMPSVRVDGMTVHYPIARSTQIAHEYLALLGACDGEKSARTIAGELSTDPDLGISEEDVYGMLAELVEQRLIRWTLEIPTSIQHPEQHLRQTLERLPPSGARDRALDTLASIEAARDAIEKAAGDAVTLDRELGVLEELFSSLTDLAATRQAGKTYAGRTLIYEDTRRNVEVELGTRFLERIGPPLTLLMISARWYTHSVAFAYHRVFRDVYQELRERTGQASIDYLQYLEQVLPHFATQKDVAPLVRPIVDELHARWTELLGVSTGAKHIECSAASLLSRVEAAFEAPCPGWPQARYQSPDVMVAAADLESFIRGDFSFVLSEIHTGYHSYYIPIFLNVHPDPVSVFRARHADMGRPLVANVEPRAGTLRTDQARTPGDFDIELGDARSGRANEQVLRAAQLVVEEVGGQLVVRTRDGRRSFDVAEAFEGHLLVASATHFTLLPPLPHTPRISIDGLVVTRESWQFSPAELSFALEKSSSERFIGARRWAQRHALPRFIFVRVPHETKPCFVDLTSPIYVEMLARFVRQASAVSISEMLPAIDQTWLVDARGGTYTSELRMTVVDPKRWRPEP